MLVPIQWLRDYVDVPDDLNTFADRMTLSGTKVEAVESRDAGIKNVVTAKVTAMENHPDSDHMWICTMDNGTQTNIVVTGAQNVSVGDIVPYAQNNSVVAERKKIKTAKLRGIESEGMLCSAPELGIDGGIAPKFAQDGIYILPSDTPLGIDIKEILGLNDTIIDFELTNNRQDCNSILGIAYEASATLGKEFQYPLYEYPTDGNEIHNYLSVAVKNYDLCKRYTARMVKIIRVEPSPMWMQVRLMAAGVRPINNIVDVSNFVMLETGEPLHTFDYDKLAGGKIVVQTAKQGETMMTLDGVERHLNENILMIDDGEKHVAIAGIMGGGNSDIDQNTKTVVIEAANFDKNSIRKSAKHFGMRTESSAHFEKGISMHLTKYAADRAASLLVSIGAAEYIDGIIDCCETLDKPMSLSVDRDWLSRFSGIDFSVKEIVRCLSLLGFEPKTKGRTVCVTVPRFRQDIQVREDLAEEIIRMYGYDRIPNTMMQASGFVAEPNRDYNTKQEIKRILRSAGGFELLSYSFISPSKLEQLRYPKDDGRSDPAVLVNPLGEENSVMRTTLLTGFLDAVSVNENRKNAPELLFELGGVYLKNQEREEGLPGQFEMLVFGKSQSDFYEMKSIAEYLFAALKIRNVSYVRSDEGTLHSGRSADIMIDGQKIGYLGQIHPMIAKSYGVPEQIAVAELDAEKLVALAGRVVIQAAPLAKYPAVERDLALVCDENVMAGEVAELIHRHGGEYLVSCEVFDVYRNEEVLGENKKSIAFSLLFRSDTETLTDEETDTVIAKILSGLKDEKDIVLRT